MKPRVSKSALRGSKILYLGRLCCSAFIYVSVIRGFGWVYSVGESGLVFSTSIAPCLRTGEPFLLASTWETQMHLALSENLISKTYISLRCMVFKVSWLPQQPPRKATCSSPFFLVLLVSIAEHWPAEPQRWLSGGSASGITLGLLSTSTQRLLGRENFCSGTPLSAHWSWPVAEANRNSVQTHEPGACFYFLCENQSITRLAGGRIQILPEPKSLLGNTSHKIQRTSKTWACLSDFTSSCEWP